MADEETKSQTEKSTKNSRPPVKDSVLELRTRMTRLMSIVDITPHSKLPVPACVSFVAITLIAMLQCCSIEGGERVVENS